MLSYISPRVLGVSLFFVLTFSHSASAQVTFATHTYPNNNLWNWGTQGINGHVRADLNQDGREDFISSNDASFNSECTGSFAVTLSSGDGTYAAPVCYTIPSGVALYFAVGSFFNSSYMDVIVTNDKGQAYVYENNGDGGLSMNRILNLNGVAGAIVAADVNHDGALDLVYTASPSTLVTTLYVLFGDGGGGFYDGPSTTFSVTGGPAPLLVGDFDGDGRADILVRGNKILYGDGTGHFTPTSSVGTELSFLPADPNSDGVMSLIGAAPRNVINIQHGHYDRVFTSQNIPLKSCVIGDGPVMADFDGDGYNDIIVAEDADCKNNGPYTLNFLKNTGNGSLTPTFAPEQVIYSTSDYIWELHVMRASSSSKPDLTVFQSALAANSQILNREQLVLVNTTTGSFPACAPPFNLDSGISVCSPTSTSGFASPVTFSFGGAAQTPARDMEIWVDGTKIAENLRHNYSYFSFANATVSLSPGEHTVSAVAVGWDYSLRYITFPLIIGGTTCPPPTSDGLNVCSPITESTATSPVLAWAGGNATGEGNLVRMEVWVDFVKQFSTFGSNQLKTSIVLSPGIHRFDYFLVSSYGIKWQQTVYTNVK